MRRGLSILSISGNIIIKSNVIKCFLLHAHLHQCLNILYNISSKACAEVHSGPAFYRHPGASVNTA